jgi:pimeloyl-ACP methyl ester carboxylesterase
MTRSPKIVVTIHGIRTRGVWQKEITPYLARHNLIPYHIDYGWFNAIKFFFPWWREQQVQSIRKELRDLVSQVGTNRRISIISHSFGTFIAMEALKKENGDFKYDRVVLAGSILPCDFNWIDLLSEEKKWVLAVYNYRATSDWVVSLARFASTRLRWISQLKARDSGRKKFIQESPYLLDHFIDGNHNEVHNPLSYERWARFIAYPFLPDDLLAKVRTQMQQLRSFAASIFKTDKALIRVNLFAFIDGALRIVPGATDNMLYVPEFDLQIEPGHGGTGVAYSDPAPCIISVKRGEYWDNNLPVDELEKIHPSLTWVLSFPIKSESRGKVVGVLNVDGLESLPTQLENKDSLVYQSTVIALCGAFLKPFQLYLDKAFCGQQIDNY